MLIATIIWKSSGYHDVGRETLTHDDVKATLIYQEMKNKITHNKGEGGDAEGLFLKCRSDKKVKQWQGQAG